MPLTFNQDGSFETTADAFGRRAVTSNNLTALGGGGEILSATVTLTDAQIKALPTTPVVLVAATETLGYSGAPSSIPIPVSAMAVLDTRGGAYTNVNAAAKLLLAFGSDWSDDASHHSYVGGGGDKMGVTRLSLVWFGVPRLLATTANVENVARIDNIFLNDNLEDNALVIACGNDVDGNFTGGNAANTLTVTVHYDLVTLP